jgi:hypothetical protein
MPDTGPEWMVCSASVEFSCAMPPELWITSIGFSYLCARRFCSSADSA